jgi:hypothetical protein
MPALLGCNASVVITLERKDSIISMLGKVKLVTECYE